MSFTEVAFTCYPAVDLAASRAFYEEVLGLVPSEVILNGEDRGWVEYDLGGHTFSIGKAPGIEPNPHGPSCGLEAADFDASVAALRKHGATFKMEPFETPVCRMAIVFDPAGNTLIIHKRKAANP
ncbi:MAG: putative Lactoylglutathione lyase [Akkermansiaceae bacterium]|nr:putative Lactoylglutathione lyase [Akkermansiaceae bacterium]